MKQNKKKFGFHLTMFGTLVLVIVLTLLFQVWKREAEPLFDNNTTTTFYAKTYVGTALKLDADRYFISESYDIKKFEFDLTQCDWNTAGIYRVPVLYDGEKTNCIFQVEVKALEQRELETVPDMNSNTKITDLK